MVLLEYTGKLVGITARCFVRGGKAELTAFPCDTVTAFYAATATLWKVEVTGLKGLNLGCSIDHSCEGLQQVLVL